MQNNNNALGKTIAYAMVVAAFACVMAALGRLFMWIVGA